MSILRAGISKINGDICKTRYDIIEQLKNPHPETRVLIRRTGFTGRTSEVR